MTASVDAGEKYRKAQNLSRAPGMCTSSATEVMRFKKRFLIFSLYSAQAPAVSPQQAPV